METNLLAEINDVLANILFFDISFGAFDLANKAVPVPFVLLLLFFGAVFFTFYYGFINIRGFRHAIDIIRGKYDHEGEHGEVSHFRALTSALSGTIGLGNIAGVAIAIQLGGPGAAFWMIVAAFFGMSSKFHSCTLSQMYRQVNADGSISGGPMYYLDLGLKQFGGFRAKFGKFFAIFYAIFVAISAVGGGCMFQTNQTIESVKNSFGEITSDLNLGIIIAVLVAVVILGGIKKIARVTSRLVPAMCAIYMLAGLIVIMTNLSNLPSALSTIVSMAFSSDAAYGGMVGIFLMGIRRGSFSNEAGLGSAAIVHAAAKTNQPVREGLVAMLGPFIDTIIVCFTTALVVVITGTWNNPEIVAQGGNIGVTITSEAFKTVLPSFPIILTICVALFAYSSMLSWCYYGERGWIYLLDHYNGSGLKTVIVYRLFFVVAILIGATNELTDVINFTDFITLSLVIPNILGSLFLAGIVKKRIKEYFTKLDQPT